MTGCYLQNDELLLIPGEPHGLEYENTGTKSGEIHPGLPGMGHMCHPPGSHTLFHTSHTEDTPIIPPHQPSLSLQ